MNDFEDIKSLSDVELEKQVVDVASKERKATVKFLWYLLEFDNRKGYLELGYSSLFDYCVRRLGFSEGGAYRRITACRALRENPEVATCLEKGSVSLCSLAAASKSLKANTSTLQDITGKSKREVLEVVSKDTPIAKPLEVIKPIGVMSLPLEDAPIEERYQIKFSVSKETFERFNEAKKKLSNSLPDMTFESVLEKLLDNYLNKVHRKTTVKKPSRYIPRFVKQEIYKRDGGQCTFVAKDGTRCCERNHLHIDHIDPYSLGGLSTVDNLRLLCSAHNLYEARQLVD